MTSTSTPLGRYLEKAIDAWALLGGAVLVVLVLINVWSVVGGALGLPFAGDVELTEMGVAMAAFSFLPFCQLHGHNVRADIFTQNAGPKVRRTLDTVASAMALGFAALLLWRMYFGLLDQKSYNYSSTILQVPLWWPYVPILVSLVLLVVAAAMTLLRDVRGTA
ncbi:Tripartite ATP-independent periplasmic transporter, DctQ component (plasmid) [Roseivivax sp. THAF40]|uniref:TRAP transporter small permease n=1 Tax=unclassified Roseivivax TaxID=2639302 RepID=UPI0012682066|nr:MULTISPECIES: TRAP transporter small permease [unclassified Roseivivax]QFS84929.1 Tripartite ATP-independent periplasmic transporter, DctQ component [Roseivivax sp. THAF197b]QFT48630.1 Tripartite ATP-independent periplasmic transporter, DctQ component [Roseivivax sp. THAF40]